MTSNELLQEQLVSLFEGAEFEQGNEWLTMQVPCDKLYAIALTLKNDTLLQFDYLFCLTCVDWKTHFTMVYHFTSTIYRHTLVIKSKVDRQQPIINTVCTIWPTAELHEREVYDLFGVHFKGHPDLRRLLLTDDWKGFPLRKDYEDPINMIKL